MVLVEIKLKFHHRLIFFTTRQLQMLIFKVQIFSTIIFWGLEILRKLFWNLWIKTTSAHLCLKICWVTSPPPSPRLSMTFWCLFSIQFGISSLQPKIDVSVRTYHQYGQTTQYTVKIEESKTIGDLKQKIVQQLNTPYVPLQQVQLWGYTESKQRIELQNDRTVKSYGITSDTVIDLTSKFPFNF